MCLHACVCMWQERRMGRGSVEFSFINAVYFSVQLSSSKCSAIPKVIFLLFSSYPEIIISAVSKDISCYGRNLFRATWQATKDYKSCITTQVAQVIFVLQLVTIVRSRIKFNFPQRLWKPCNEYFCALPRGVTLIMWHLVKLVLQRQNKTNRQVARFIDHSNSSLSQYFQVAIMIQ